eukprot:TRINITY_DN51403_c0_g1_i1.p1 TRINITY_DN51403_c0_g1~~TRINITY_DN51403_c0_g1_i1.p1  ORF type:complete len:542 (+),score=60.36 TRINITY_DN51403_c0_g1_i1:42-1667(+)
MSLNSASAGRLCFYLLLAWERAASGHAHAKPHVLWIVADDLGWDDLGFRNGHQIDTPIIDGLAKAGVVLGNYYVQPSCSPTRATFLSGRYPLHTGVNSFIPPNRNKSYGLPLNETTVAQLLRSRGYRAHAIGKWHVGDMSYAYTPTFRGFESFYGFYGGGENYFTHMTIGAYDLRRDHKERCGKGCSHIAVEDYGHYSTTLFTTEAVKVIEQHDASSPLFLYLAYQAVHGPDAAPERYTKPYDGRISDTKRHTFAGMLSALDEGVGNVTRALYEKGMLENTFIIFTTDNGGPAEVCGVTGTSNYPYRGSKCSVWEGGTRGTAMVLGPGLQQTGIVFEGLMHAADWLPTIMAMVGEPAKPGETLPLDGYNLWPALAAGYGQVRKDIYYGVTDLKIGALLHGPALRIGKYKLIVGKNGGAPGSWSRPANLTVQVEVSNDGVVLHEQETVTDQFPPLENVSCALYDLSSDPGEHFDISADHGSIVQEMLSRVKEITKVMACMDCSDPRCPDAIEAQVEVKLPTGSLVKAWEPYCDDADTVAAFV